MQIVKTEKGNLFPIKAMTEDTRSKKVLELGIWLSKLLSLKDDTSAERLEVLLPMVSEFCWSMSIEDIKKAFTMYIRSDLPGLEPRTNYLDVILFGKIIKAYKQAKPIEKKVIELPQISTAEKENLIYMGVINCFDSYVQTKNIIVGYTWIYDHLFELNLFDYTPEQKREKMKRAKVILKHQANENNNVFEVKSILTDLERKNAPSIINESKRLLLCDYFQSIVNNKKHIKDYLK